MTAITLRKTPALLEELEQSLQSKTLGVMHVIDSTAPLYAADVLRVSAGESKARLQQISSSLILSGSKPANPSLQYFQERAAEVRKPSLSLFARTDRLNRMERMLEANVAATVLNVTVQVLGVIGKGAKAVCERTPLKADCAKQKKHGLKVPPRAIAFLHNLNNLSIKGFDSFKEENDKLGIPSEMTEQYARDAISVVVGGMTMGVGKVTNAWRAAYVVRLEKEVKLLTFLNGGIPRLVKPKGFPDNLNQFLIKPLELPFAAPGYKGKLVYKPFDNHFLFLIQSKSGLSKFVTKTQALPGNVRPAILTQAAVEFAERHGKKTLLAFDNTKVPLLSTIIEEKLPLQVLSLGTMGERIPYTIVEVVRKR